MALNRGESVFWPDDQATDPSITGELLGSRPALEGMTLSQIVEEAGKSKLKPMELVDAPDIAEYLLNRGATRGHFAQIFDEASMRALDASGMLPAAPMFDPSTYGEREARMMNQDPTLSGVGGEFSQRFIEEAGHGLRRRYEAERGGLNLAEPAFPAGYQRVVDKANMELSVDPNGEALNTPVIGGLLRAGMYTAKKLGAGDGGYDEGTHSRIENMVGGVMADEVNQAPQWLDSTGISADAKTYTDGFFKDELGKAFARAGEEGVGAIVGGGLLFDVGGAMLGWMGRSKDTINASMQSVTGWFMAQLARDAMFSRMVNVGVGLVSSSPEQIIKSHQFVRDQFAYLPEDDDLLNYLATGDDHNIREMRREFMQTNSDGWGLGLKGMTEGAITLPIEIMMKGPPIGAVARSVGRRIPMLMEITGAAKLARTKAWKAAKAKVPLIQPLTDKEQYSIWFKLSKDRANRIAYIQEPVDNVLSWATHGVEK